MRGNWLLGLVTVVALVGAGGIGFAAFTTTATVNGSATGGTAELHWSGTPSTSASGYVTGCSPSFGTSDGIGATVMTIAAAGFAPGDSCTVTENLVNGGTVGLTFTSAPTITGITNGNGCGTNEWTIGDNVASSGNQAPGSTFAFTVTVTLNSGAGNECQGAVAALSDVVTGTSYA